MSHRKQQIESTMQRAISQILSRRLSDPRLCGMISITQVDIAPDMHQAKVHVSVLPPERQQLVLNGLRHATGHIRTELRKAITLRKVPQLDFRIDETLKKQDTVWQAIERGVEREEQHPPGGVQPQRLGEDEAEVKDTTW